MAEAKTPPGQPGTVEGQQLAQLVGIDIRTVREMGEKGVMVRVGRNRYDFVRSIRGYTAHLRELASGHRSEGGPNNLAENAMFTRERRRKLNMEAEVAAGKLIPVELVEAVMVDTIKGVRAMILGFSNEAQAELPHLSVSDFLMLKQISEKVLRDNVYRTIEDTKMHPEIQQYIDEKRGVKSI